MVTCAKHTHTEAHTNTPKCAHTHTYTYTHIHEQRPVLIKAALFKQLDKLVAET